MEKAKDVVNLPFQFCGTLLLLPSVLHNIQHNTQQAAFLPGRGMTTDLSVEQPTSGVASMAHDHHSLQWSPSLRGTPVDYAILTIQRFI